MSVYGACCQARREVLSVLTYSRIGASGQVGGALIEAFGDENVIGTYSNNARPGMVHFDLEAAAKDPQYTEYLITMCRPEVVCICAGRTWVDGCENEGDVPFLANRDAPRLIARFTKGCGGRTVFFSEGVVSLYVDMKKTSLLDILCEVSQYDVVIVPHGSETIFPVILKKRCIILINDWESDTFYFEALSQFMVTHTFLHMHSIPHVAKPHHPYYAQFSPTVDEMQALENLVNANEFSPQYQRLTFRPKGTSGEGGLLQKVVDTRTKFVSVE